MTSNAYRSKFEGSVAQGLRSRKLGFEFEPESFEFVQPSKPRKYTPDFKLSKLGTYVECKGKFTKEDRDKLLWVREQNPELDLVLLFMRANNFIRKGSKTRYKDWADKNNFQWFDWEHSRDEFFNFCKGKE